MHDIFAATKAQLIARKAALHDLIAAVTQQGDQVAEAANAEIARLKAEAEGHEQELTGIRHSLDVLDHLAAQTPPPAPAPAAPTPPEAATNG